MYSDKVSHALSFAAKQLAQDPSRPAAELARPATLAVLLARYDCDEPTTQAGILSELLTLSLPGLRPAIERRIVEKFGTIVHGVAVEAAGPDLGPQRRSLSRTWESAQCDVLEHFADAEPRTLDVRAGMEIIACGALLTDLRRLGPEYLPQMAAATGAQLVWWFGAFAETLDQHEAWQRRSMLTDLRLLTKELAEAIRAT